MVISKKPRITLEQEKEIYQKRWENMMSDFSSGMKIDQQRISELMRCIISIDAKLLEKEYSIYKRKD